MFSVVDYALLNFLPSYGVEIGLCGVLLLFQLRPSAFFDSFTELPLSLIWQSSLVCTPECRKSSAAWDEGRAVAALKCPFFTALEPWVGMAFVLTVAQHHSAFCITSYKLWLKGMSPPSLCALCGWLPRFCLLNKYVMYRWKLLKIFHTDKARIWNTIWSKSKFTVVHMENNTIINK